MQNYPNLFNFIKIVLKQKIVPFKNTFLNYKHINLNINLNLDFDISEIDSNIPELASFDSKNNSN
jgi:hypothetical protein